MPKYEATPENIANEYKKYRRKGRPHEHWLGQFKQLHEEGNLPPEWLAYLNSRSDSKLMSDLISSLDSASKEYFRGERSYDLQQAQKVFSSSPAARAAQSAGGFESGNARRLKRDQAMAKVATAYRAFKRLPDAFKPNARSVARWHVSTTGHGNVDSLTRRLRASGVAE